MVGEGERRKAPRHLRNRTAGGARPSLQAERVERLAEVVAWWEGAVPSLGHPFALPDWLLAYAEHVETERAPRTYRCTDASGATVALVLLARRLDGVVRFLGDPLSDRAGPICRDAAYAQPALRAALAQELAPGDRFVGRAMLASEGWSELGGTRLLERVPSPVADLGEGWSGYLAARGRSVRRSLGRLDRLAAAGELRTRRIETTDDLRDALAAQVRMHVARFSKRSRLYTPARRAFVEAACLGLLARGALSMWVLEDADQAVIATYLGFRWAGAEWFWQHSFALERARLSPGRMLLGHAVRDAAAAGCDRFHLLLGDEPYKARWANGDDPVVTIQIGPAT